MQIPVYSCLFLRIPVGICGGLKSIAPPSRSCDVTSSANAMTLAPPPSLIDTSRRGGCLPHRAVDAVSTSSFIIIDAAGWRVRSMSSADIDVVMLSCVYISIVN